MATTLGIDWGERRLGFAVSDPLGLIATTLHTAHISSRAEALAAAESAFKESGAARIVIGLPVNMDGQPGPMAERVRAFADDLAARLDVPVDCWDERLSSAQAERTMRDAGMSARRRKQARDKLAARIILQSWLDAHQDPEPLP